MSNSTPMNEIEEWQTWFKKDKTFGPSPTQKELINISNEMSNLNSIKNSSNFQKIKEAFEDILVECQEYGLTCEDVYEAFFAAATDQMQQAKKEYEHCKELVDMLRYYHLGKD